MSANTMQPLEVEANSGTSFDHLDASAQAEVQLMFMARENLKLFEALYETYAESIYAYCLRHTANVAEAEDLRSQVFVRALKGVHSFRGGLVAAWLFRIAHNELVNFYRKNRRPIISLDSLELPDERDESWDEIELSFERHTLALMIKDLPQDHRNLLMMSFYQGLTSPEIGAVLSRNPITVRTGLRRIIKGLQAQCSALMPEPSLGFSN